MPTAKWHGAVIAESDDTVVVERNHYFPRSSLQPQYFRDSAHTSRCPWKGTANYLTIVVDGDENRDAAWYYAEPSEAAKAITDGIAFWRGVEVVD